MHQGGEQGGESKDATPRDAVLSYRRQFRARELSKCMICWRKCGFYLPFAITHTLVLYFLTLYICTYLMPLLASTSTRLQGALLLSALIWLVFWLEVSLAQAVRTNPGGVPPNAVSTHSNLQDNQEFDYEEDASSDVHPSRRHSQPFTSRDAEEPELPHRSSLPATPPSDTNRRISSSHETSALNASLSERFAIVRSQVPLRRSGRQDFGGQGQGQQRQHGTVREVEERGTEDEPLLKFRTIEKDKDGYNRFCKFCLHSKPDRSHHCKVCGTCVLKMDHHCPWILNCVGYYNYKFFLLLLFYAGLSCLLIACTFWQAVAKVVMNPGSSFVRMYGMLMSYLLAVVLFLVLFSFLTFHLFWLLLPNYTTIQFCEKRKDPSSFYSSYSPFNMGCGNNFKQALGTNCLLWFFPVAPRKFHPRAGLEFEFNARFRHQYVLE